MSETVVVLNPRTAGGKGLERWRRHAHVLEDVLGRAREIHAPTKRAAVEAVRGALRGGARNVIVAGGDGSVNAAVNGFFEGPDARPVAPDATLAVLPIGTGNDYARSIGLHGVPLEESYAGATVRSVDVGVMKVTGASGEREPHVFANTAAFGMGSRIAADVSGSAKRLGGWLAYWIGTVHALLTARTHRVRLTLDDDVSERVVNLVTIGNGRYVGGGMKIAPAARLDDGLLEVIVIDAIGLLDFFRHSGRLYAGTHVDLPFVHCYRVRRCAATPLGNAPVLADVEGDPEGHLPMACEVRPAALRVLAPWHRAEAVGG